jgi:tripartite-type tricarboxylate transporter receptor subunit TctC
MLKRIHRFAAAGFAIGMAFSAPTGALAQAYPEKPVRIVVPFAPGGRVEGIARLLGQSLAAQLGQPFVVESRAGAGGAIGSDFVAKAPKDGYTLLLVSAGTHAILPNVDKALPYESVRDFTPIANLVEGFTFLGAHPSVGATTVAELVKLAKEKPGQIGFATSGIGTYGHFAGELLKISSGANLLHVPYKGSGPALNDLAAGHVPLMVAGELVELAKANKIRVLATTNERRWPELPDVPTMAEAGFPQFKLHSWIGLAGPPACRPMSSRN